MKKPLPQMKPLRRLQMKFHLEQKFLIVNFVLIPFQNTMEARMKSRISELSIK